MIEIYIICKLVVSFPKRLGDGVSDSIKDI